MVPNCKFFIPLSLLSHCFLAPSNFAQDDPAAFPRGNVGNSLVRLVSQDSSYQLQHEFIIENSETVLVDSTVRLSRGLDYEIDYRFGRLSFHREILRRIFADSVDHVAFVSYRSLPLVFKKEYTLRQQVVRKDSIGQEKLMIVQPSPRLSVADYFGSGLQKSGSIARGFTVGSNRDLSLSSGFRMQLAGKLSEDVDVVAALTDETSPIQPEGTTQTLREVDKVFIELKSAKYGATLGDFHVDLQRNEAGEFARLSRKLQGARATASNLEAGGFAENVTANLTAAATRGKYHTNQFQGIEGNQGPYRLSGINGERRLIIVAGSERVYLNGNLMTRGEINDYTIDYASGELVFTTRQLITSASRINVDFEYSDRQFTRNFVSGHTSLSGFGEGLKLNVVFVQEADDPDSPIDAPLDDASRDILRQSGSDRLRATLSGVRSVGRDSITQSGRGQYLVRDSVIGGRTYSILHYAPGDSLAIYTVSFSQLDRVPGDSAGYVRVGIGHFRFAGIGGGNYLPIQFLPMPQLQRILDFNAEASVSSDFSVSGEYAVSQLDRNRFSKLDDQDRAGSAFKFAARFNPKELKLGETNLGEIDLIVSERFVDRRFVSPDRLNEVEFNRNWNLDSAIASHQEIREASLLYKPVSPLSISGSYGSLDRSGRGHSRRLRSELSFNQSALPVVRYQFENIENSNADLNSQSLWIRQRGDIEHSFGVLQPGFGVEAEKRTIGSADSLLNGSFRFLQLAPRVNVVQLARMSASAEFQIRAEDSASQGSLRRAMQSLTQTYSWQLNEWNAVSSALNLSIRKTQFADDFKARANVNSEVILVRSLSRYTPFQRAVETDAYYEFASQRSARLERVFVRVSKGSGNYLYKGDLNGNGIADEDEFELTRFEGDFIAVYVPTDQLTPVVDLKTSLRVRLQPMRFFRDPVSHVEKILRVISTETFVRIDERSSEPDAKQIYLLNFRRFQNDATTIAGSNQLTQDLFLFEHSPDLSFRFRYSEKAGFLQLVSANERSFQKERSVRIRSQLLTELGNQTDYSNKIDRVTSTGPSLRARDLSIDALNSDFSYRPERQWEIGFVLTVSSVVDRFTPVNATADINELGLRVVYALFGSGQVRGEVRREEVVVTNATAEPLRALPFEFTNGKAVGKNYLWQLAFDYRISQNVHVTLNYNGRSEGARTPVHVARVEARAFF